MFLAYKYVAISLMLAQINGSVSNLNLPVAHPIDRSDVSYSLIAPPEWHYSITAGRIDAEHYTFAFSDAGKLRFIWRIKPFGNSSISDRNDMLVHEKPFISEVDAYRLASNWLSRMPVDVDKLQKQFHWHVKQEYRWRPGGIGKDLLPLYKVKWGKWDEPAADVEIDGRTKQLLEIRLEDPSVSQAPEIQVRNRDQLMAISDQEFLKYSEQQRRQLIQTYIVNGIGNASVK